MEVGEGPARWRLKEAPTEAALPERDADPFFFAPDDVTGPLGLSARHKKREAVRDKERRHNLKRRARF